LSQTLQNLNEYRSSHLAIEVEHVIRGQGIDPAHPNARSPQLLQLAQRAIEIGQPLIKPVAIYRRLAAIDLIHDRLRLAEEHTLHGSLIGQHFSRVTAVVIVLCTVGHGLDSAIDAAYPADPALALALDGFGTAAIEALANDICHVLECKAAAQEMQITIPLSPGMIGWPVDQGQAQIFNALDAQSIGVTLNNAFVMTPKKSLSFVVGEGLNLQTGRNTCEYCAMNEICRYQHHYEPELNQAGPKSRDHPCTRQQAYRSPSRHTIL